MLQSKKARASRASMSEFGTEKTLSDLQIGRQLGQRLLVNLIQWTGDRDL
jgi:hypothetical protein